MMAIGDEILSGSVADTNTPWLAKLLHRSALRQVCCRNLSSSAHLSRCSTLKISLHTQGLHLRSCHHVLMKTYSAARLPL